MSSLPVGSSQTSNEEKRSWRFCNDIRLPKTEVVFFVQMFFVAWIIIVSCIKLLYREVECEERVIWISLLSSAVGYVLPNPKI